MFVLNVELIFRSFQSVRFLTASFLTYGRSNDGCQQQRISRAMTLPPVPTPRPRVTTVSSLSRSSVNQTELEAIAEVRELLEHVHEKLMDVEAKLSPPREQ